MLLHAAFVLAWAALAGIGVRFGGARVFASQRGAWAAAAVTAFAFACGAFSPLARLEPPPAPPAAAPVTAAAAPAFDAQRICRDLPARSGRVAGSLDMVSVGATSTGGTVATALRADTVVLRGWATTLDPAVPARGTCLEIDGRVRADASVQYGLARPDVAANFGSEALADTGYVMTIPAVWLAPGRHRLGVRVVGASSSGVVPKTVQLTVR